ncbi:MAG: hypothetical protein AB8H80_07465 [Planctomycetota bacterium]
MKKRPSKSWLRRISWRKLWPRTRRGAGILAIALLTILWWTSGGAPAEAHATDVDRWPREQVLAAIRWVESSDRDNVPDGDGGRAIGSYQIHRVYWLDAHAHDPSLGGDYQQCRQRRYAERVIDAYMRRYVPEAWQNGEGETIARVHNGGPKGHERSSTDGYWQRVRARLGEPLR